MRASISDLQRRLRRYLNHVQAGKTVLVTDRNRPIAEIRPVSVEAPKQPVRKRRWKSDEEWLEDAERRGLLRRGTGKIPWEILNPPTLGKGAGLVDILLKEREESR